MKTIVTFLFLFFYLFSHSQFLGQTKTYIINKNSDWEISVNTSELMIMSKGSLSQFFSFNSNNNYLCDIFGMELLNMHKLEMLSTLLLSADSWEEKPAPVLISCKHGNSYSSATYYYLKDVQIIVYHSDMCGDPSTGKFLIQYRQKPQ